MGKVRRTRRRVTTTSFKPLTWIHLLSEPIWGQLPLKVSMKLTFHLRVRRERRAKRRERTNTRTKEMNYKILKSRVQMRKSTKSKKSLRVHPEALMTRKVRRPKEAVTIHQEVLLLMPRKRRSKRKTS